MKKLIIIRGLPGSGKSYLAKQLVGEGIICSSDYFFTSSNGEYKFSYSHLGNAHSWCKNEVLRQMIFGTSPIVVDNTNVRKWELDPYIDMAKNLGYVWEIKEPQTSWAKDPNECFARNQHGVPLETILKQAEEWADAAELE
jgi:predicted kinase